MRYWIYGTGELAKTMYYQLGKPLPRQSDFLGFIGDPNFLSYPSWIPQNCPVEVFTTDRANPLGLNIGIYLPIGYKNCNNIKENIFNRSKDMGLIPLNFISEKADIESTVDSKGCWIQSRVAIQSDVSIGNGVVLWGGLGCHIGHSSIVEDFCYIATGSVISGNCKIGYNSFIGINCSIKDNIEIAHHTYLGMGSIITKPTKPYEVYLAGVNNLYNKTSLEI